MVTRELYKLEKQGITKDGHTMFYEDIVNELNGWRNSARDMRNKNALLLHEIGKQKAITEMSDKEIQCWLLDNGINNREITFKTNPEEYFYVSDAILKFLNCVSSDGGLNGKD